MDRRRDDPLRGSAAREVRRIAEVGDAWLDAGIVHFSTLGWQNETWVEHGNGTGAAGGLTGADLPDHAYWEEWFPADWVTEMREQIRLWFYSQCFMAVTLDGPTPYRRVLAYERMLRRARQRDAQVEGQRDRAGRGARADGRRRDALALLRAAAEPAAALRLRPGGRRQAAAAHVLELRLVLRHVRERRRLRPDERRAGRAAAARPLARRPHARGSCATRPTRTSGTGRQASSRRSRSSSTTCRTGTSGARGAASGRDDRPRSASSGTRSTTAIRVISPVMPFFAEHLWRDLVSGDESVFLAPWPEDATSTRSCSRRWRRCGGSSSSAARRARRRG